MSTRYPCIYRITSNRTQKVYIGSAEDFDRRVSAHISRLNANTHHNKHLQSAWNLYGADTFTFECIEECSKSELIKREQYWIDYYCAADPRYGYNIAPIAGNTSGKKHTTATKQKIRLKALGRVVSDETRVKHSISTSGTNNPMYGRHHSDSSKESMRYLSNGVLRSVAYSGKNNHFYGKTHSAKTRALISEKRAGVRSRTKLTESDVHEIKSILSNKPKGKTNKRLFEEIGKKFSVSSACVRKIYTGERWGEIS